MAEKKSTQAAAQAEEAKAAVQEAAAQETAAQEENLLEKKTTIRIPLDRGNKDDVFVGINGRTWQIKRGVTVEVPVAVALVLAQSERMQMAAMDFEEQAASGLEGLEQQN